MVLFGYVFSSYLEEVPEIQITDIKLSLEKEVINKDERIKLNVEIIPEDVKQKSLKYSSSNTHVAIIDNDGNILGVGQRKNYHNCNNSK